MKKYNHILTHSMSSTYSIPRTLWESLDAILFTKGLALAKEIAADLGVPSQPLVAALNGQERGKFTIIPDDDATYQCQALIPHGATYMRCRHVSLKPAPSYCQEHERYVAEIPRGLTQVRRIDGSDVPYVLNGTNVYDLNGNKCGILKGSSVIIYQIEA